MRFEMEEGNRTEQLELKLNETLPVGVVGKVESFDNFLFQRMADKGEIVRYLFQM